MFTIRTTSRLEKLLSIRLQKLQWNRGEEKNNFRPVQFESEIMHFILIVGQEGTGKTTITKSLFHHILIQLRSIECVYEVDPLKQIAPVDHLVLCFFYLSIGLFHFIFRWHNPDILRCSLFFDLGYLINGFGPFFTHCRYGL